MTKTALQGGAYQAHSVIASAQRCVNLVQEPMPEAQGEPMPSAAYPTPGTRLLGSIGPGPIRGIRQSTTGATYCVSGSNVYLVDTVAWTGTLLGTITAGLRTPVSMADNGLDMVIVDGTANGWKITLVGNVFAQISNTSGTITPVVESEFPGAMAANDARYTPFDPTSDAFITSATITLGSGYTGHLKCAIFDSAANRPSGVLGSAATLTNPSTGVNRLSFTAPVAVTAGSRYWIGFDSDTNHGTWALAAAGTGEASATPYASFPAASPVVELVQAPVCSLSWETDPGSVFVGADRVDFLDTYLLFNKPQTPQFYSSDSLALTFDPLWFANKESYSDLLQTLVVAKRNIWLFGSVSTEVWANVGKADFPFESQGDVFIDHGVVAKYSVAEYDNGVFWLSRDRQGQGIVIMGAGYQTKRVSTYAIEAEIAGYERISDAIGYCYQLSGHAFYVLSFPRADKTWSYDITTGLWHEWVWIDTNGDEHRHRSNCYWPINGTPVVGDWQNGNLYALDQRVFTDNGMPIKRVRSFPHILADGKRVFYRQFIADLETGNAPQVSVAVPERAPYDLQLSQVNLNVFGIGKANTVWGFPGNTDFHTLLMSYWMCGPMATPATGTGSCAIWPAFMSAGFFGFGDGANGIKLTNATLGSSGHFYQGTFALPSPGTLSHFLFSVDTHAQTVQLYINDIGVAVTGGTWTGTPPFNFNIANAANIWFWDVFHVIQSGQYPAMADAWISNTPSFVDLSVESNRRRFINRDLTAVDLGNTGSNPFGYQPALYMSVRPGGVPEDLKINRGVGGGVWDGHAVTLTSQAPGACAAPPAPPPLPVPVDQNLISLEWSDDRGHSFGSPVTQNIGEAGEYRTSLQWARLGMSRDRVWRLSWSVPMATALLGCYFDATPAGS